MSFQDLTEKSTEQLGALLAEKQEEARVLRFKAKEGQLKTLRDIRKVKKMIAQIHTILAQRTAEAAK